MIFANGDCSITYQQSETISNEQQESVKKSFYESKNHKYLQDILMTENTVTFLYEPISVMEAHNTIEPSGIVINEVRGFLEEEGFAQ
ncbi:hypothetical protein [Corticicoccus populi]|uniref:Uncharacterized protein n=1 Tax=Corticicoccus populi TaxID=1812821 RepID=A0ABW5WV98_9STAP